MKRLSASVLFAAVMLHVSSDISGQVFVDNVRLCDAFPGDDAGEQIAACIAALPSSGGTADARGIQSVARIAEDPFAGATKRIFLKLGAATFIASTDITVPQGVTLEFGEGGLFFVNPNRTLTIDGAIQAPLNQIFAGSGAVKINGSPKASARAGPVYPQWFGAVGDGETDDTLAFQNALNATYDGLNRRTRPLTLSAGDYVISNLILRGLNSDSAGQTWGLIGAGAGTTIIRGAKGATGFLIKTTCAGESERPCNGEEDSTGGGGYRRFVLKGVKLIGNRTYSGGLQLGPPTAAARIVIGDIEDVEVTNFSNDAPNTGIGVSVRHMISSTIRHLYSHDNGYGLILGDPLTGGNPVGGNITSTSIENSQFRSNKDGVRIHDGHGLRFYNNVYEANASSGLVLFQNTAAIGNARHIFIGDWAEANALSGLLIDSDTHSRGAPNYLRFIMGNYDKGSEVGDGIRIRDGSDVVFESTNVRTTVNVDASQGNRMWFVNSISAMLTGQGAPNVATLGFLGNIPNAGFSLGGNVDLASGDLTVSGSGRNIAVSRGAMRLTPDVAGGGLSLESVDLGGVAGPSITVGRDSNSERPCAGTYRWTRKDGAIDQTWTDSAGLLRISSLSGPCRASDTGGSVIGDQASNFQSKNVWSRLNNPYGALAAVLKTPVYLFAYKDGRYNGETFVGPVTEEAPWIGKDNNRSLNEMNMAGYFILSIQALSSRIWMVLGLSLAMQFCVGLLLLRIFVNRTGHNDLKR